MRVLFSAGEASGDAYAAELACRLKQMHPSLHMAGIGGPRSREAGVELLADSSSWGAIGIIEALKVAPKAFFESRSIVRELKKGPAGLFVPIDFGYLNIRLCRVARSAGWRVVYFVPPGSWRKNKQGADLPALTDAIITPFSWSAELLNRAGAKALWFGHPLKELVGQVPGGDRPVIAVLPGSRLQEIHANLDSIIPAVNALNRPVEIAVARSMDPQWLQSLWISMGGPSDARFCQGRASDVLGRAVAALVCSGTATLEAALCRTPMVVMYRGSKLIELEFRIRKPKFDYISLPNILLNRPLLPELLQHEANPGALVELMNQLIQPSPLRRKQLEGFDELDAILGPGDALTRSAAWLAENALQPHG